MSWPGFLASFVVTSDISDHLPIVSVTKIADPPCAADTPVRQLKRLFTASSIDRLKYLLLTESWESVYAAVDPNTAYDNFLSRFQHLSDVCMPLTLVGSCSKSRARKPWVTPAICKSAAVHSKLYKQFLKQRVPKDEYTRYRNTYYMLVKQAKADYYAQFFDKNIKNTKAVWNMINNLTPYVPS
jgi:hypothetical protein